MNSGGKNLADPDRVYWDSCAWLGLVNGEQDKKAALGNTYNQARKGLIQIWTSTLSIVEANRLTSESGAPKPLPPDSIRQFDDVFFQHFVYLVPLDTPIARTARNMVRETPNLRKKADAIHLATALFWSIPVLHTYDENDLLHLDRQMNCRDGTVLRICRPGEETDGGLFDKSLKESS